MSLVAKNARFLALATLASFITNTHLNLTSAQSTSDKTIAQAILASHDVQQ
jgi:hypothetical protein